nr:hypothetical protein [Streptomyces hoynatensis]
MLADLRGLAETAPDRIGALWKLAEPGRQLDANLVHLPAHQRVERHVEPDLDVLVLVLGGRGTLHAPREEGAAGHGPEGGAEQDAEHAEGGDGGRPLAEGALCWLPHGSERAIAAGAEGLTYLTVHRRRPGMRIASRPAP